MNDLSPWGNQSRSIMPAGTPRPTSRNARQIINKVRMDGLELQGDAALTGLSMELLVGLNYERRMHAEAHPELTDLLNASMVDFAVGSQQKIKNRNSPFGKL